MLVLPDTDKPGIDRFEKVWASLSEGELASLDSIWLPIDLPTGKDLRDFLKKEGTNAFLALLREKWPVFATQDEYEQRDAVESGVLVEG